MKISNFLRRSLPLLCAALLLASLIVPASATDLDGLQNDIFNLVSACQICRTQSDDVLERSEILAISLNALAVRLEALDGQVISPIDTAVPTAEDVSGVSSYVAENTSHFQAMYQQCEAVQDAHSNCCAQQRRIKPFLQNCNSFIISLAARLDTLDGQSTDVAAFSCSNGDYTPDSSSTSSLFEELVQLVSNLKLATTACKKMNDEELAGLEAMETTFTALESRTTALDGGSGSSVPVPVLSISGDTLTLDCSDSTVTQFAIYVDDELKATIYRDSVATQYNLAQLELAAGTYQITAAAYVGASAHSDPSAAVSYTASGRIFFSVGSLSFDVDAGTTWQDFVSSASWPYNGVTLAIDSGNAISYATDDGFYVVDDVLPSDQIAAQTYDISLVSELTTFIVSIDGSAYKFSCDAGFQWAEWIRETTFPVNGCIFALEGDLVRVTKDGQTFSVSGVAGNDVIDARTYTAGAFSLAAGTWSAHSELTAWPSYLDATSLAFSSAGSSYSSMSCSIYLPSGGNCLYYGDLPVYGYGPLEKDTGWKASQYSSIYFASAQAVSYDFYTWFTANFDYVGADPVVQEVKTTINIYDQTGNVLLDTITFTGSGSAPEVSFSVGFDGCVFSSNGSDVPWSFVYADYSFMGFSVNNASGDPAYVPDESYTLPGGAGVDTVWSLYVVQTTQKLYRFNFYDTSFRLCDSFYFYADGAVTVTLMPLPVEDPNGGLTYVKFAVFYNDTNHVVEVGNFVSVWDLIDGLLYQTCCDLKTGAGPMQATKALGNAGGVFSLYFSVSAHDCLDLNGNYPDGFTAEGVIAPDPPPDDDSSGSSAGAAFAGFGNFAMDVIRGLLDFEFAPGLSLGSIVEFFVYIALFLLFLKLTS